MNRLDSEAFSGFVHVIHGAGAPWGLRDRWLRSRGTRPALEGAPA